MAQGRRAITVAWRALVVLVVGLASGLAAAAGAREIRNDPSGLGALASGAAPVWTLLGVEMEDIGSVDFELREVEVFAPDAQLVSHDGLGERTDPRPGLRFLRGRIRGVAGSVVAFSVGADGRMHGLLTDGARTWGLERGTADRRLQAKAIDASRLAGRRFQCGNDRLVEPPALQAQRKQLMSVPPAAPLAAGSLYEVRLAIETDHEFYQLFGNSTEADAYIGTLINYISAIFEVETQTRLVVGFRRLWLTSSDPWAEQTAVCRLAEFGRYWRDNPTGTTQAAAHFLSGRTFSDASGIAFRGELCTQPVTLSSPTGCASLGSDYVQGAFGVSSRLAGSYETADGLAFDAIVVAHELGHNFNSPHTHCYAGIGGVSDPVDACYSGETPAASCWTGTQTLPGLDSLTGGTSGARNGTLMSYCDLLPGGVGNIAPTFGLGHPFGVAAVRVPTRMADYVASRSAAAPACLPVVAATLDTLTVLSTGVGLVPIVSSPRAYSGFTPYSRPNVARGAIAFLEAPQEHGGQTFLGWSGCDSVSGTTCTLTMNGDRTVRARYATAITLGGAHACARTSAGGLQCWGWNADGQLGDGTVGSRVTAADVTGLGSGVSFVDSQGSYTCAVTGIGAAKCWGANGSGQLGDGTTTSRLTPVDVTDLSSGVAALAAGTNHTCALTNAGGVRCWGSNAYGLLGDGSTINRLTPVAVVGLSSGVAAVAVGSTHSCALTVAGGVKCWGYGGLLGDGEQGDVGSKLTPVDVVGLTTGVVAITAHGSHTCALTSAGAVKCWGDNGWGQLGTGGQGQALTPVDVVGLSGGVVAIAAGHSHTCALTARGGVKCWGLNLWGQVGDGSQLPRFAPVDVVGLGSGVVAIEAGSHSSCAVLESGGIKCWGNNSVGQLGDGTGIDRWTPVDVTVLQDTVPIPFIFPSQSAVARNAIVTSATITPTGYNAAASISVNGGSYSIGCTATFTTATGVIQPGQSVCVRHTSATARGATVTTSLAIGSVVGTFSSTTAIDGTSLAAGATLVQSASNAAPTVVTVLVATCPASGRLWVVGSGESAALSTSASPTFVGLAYSIARDSLATDNGNVVQSSALATFNGDANRDFLNVQRVDACTPGQTATYRLTAYRTTADTSANSFLWNGRITALEPLSPAGAGWAAGSTAVTSASHATPTVVATLTATCPASGRLHVGGSGESTAVSTRAGTAFIGLAYSIAKDSTATDNGNVVQSSALAIFNGDANRDFLNVQRVDACVPGQSSTYRLTAYRTTADTSASSFVWNGRLVASEPTSVQGNGLAAGNTAVPSSSNATPTIMSTLTVTCPASGAVLVQGSGESAAVSSHPGTTFIGLAYSIAKDSTATDNGNVVQSSALAVFNGDANRDFLNVQRVDACAPGQSSVYRLTAYRTTPDTSVTSFVWNGQLSAVAVP